MENDFKEAVLFSCFLLIALAFTPAFSAVHQQCPYTYSSESDLIRTSGCNARSHTTDVTASGVQFNVHRFSHEHVLGLVHDFLWNVRAFKESVRTEHREWRLENTNLPYSTYDLTPHARNTTMLTNSRASDKHRILRELRWWMTAIEFGVQLVHSTGQLGVRTGYVMACEASRLSTILYSLLRIFDVDMESLPIQAGCRQTEAISTDSHTHRVSLVTIILGDAVDALTRIEAVLSQCDIRAHSTGHHRVRLHCGQHASLFPAHNQRDDEVFFYHFVELVTRVRNE